MPIRLTIKRLLALAIATAAFALVATSSMALESDPTQRAFVLALMVAAAVALVTLSGRIAFGSFCAALLMGTLWLASTLKLRYLHEPLLAPDLRYLAGTLAGDVIGHYPGMLRRLLIVCVIAPAIGTLLWRLETPGLWRRGSAPRRLLASALATLPLLACLWPHGPFASVYAGPLWEFISEGARNPLSNFIRSFNEMAIVLPPRDTAAAPAQWQATAPIDTGRRPDIVAVLEESTLDPRTWADCNSPRCTFAMFQPDAFTRALGTLRVHTYGGKTWTSEFAFLIGLPHTIFGSGGVYAPFNLAPRLTLSLPRQLKALGYRTIAVYPMPADFVDARAAYQDYGFDEFHDSGELGLQWESTDLDLVAGFERIFSKARAQDPRPLFVMLLTMRQHGPHDYPLDTLPPAWRQPPAPRLDASSNRNLAHYLYRMSQSSAALARLRDFLFTDGHPTLLVHFGDHHPSFDGLERNLRSRLSAQTQEQSLQDTYFRIDTNFDAPAFAAPPVLDLAFLGALVLETAGLPKGPYFTANAVLRERCNGLFEGCSPPVLAAYFGYVLDTLHLLD